MRQSWKLAIAALAVVALMSFAAACGGDDDSSKDTATAAGTASQVASTAEGTVTTATKTTAASSTAGTTSDAIDELQKDSDNFVKADYDVTYSLTVTDAEGTKTKATMVIKHKGTKDYLAINGALDPGADNTSAIIISDGKTSWICTETEKACLKTTTDSTGGIGQMFTAIKPDKLLDTISGEAGAKVDSAPGRKIAGRDAKCYKVTTADEGNGTICFDKSTNIMLALQMSGGSDGDTNFEATKVGSAPSDNDFKPPYPVQDLGSGS